MKITPNDDKPKNEDDPKNENNQQNGDDLKKDGFPTAVVFMNFMNMIAHCPHWRIHVFLI